ncbi:MAG: hypothetical protein II984_09170 [Clostridia bacterium]|nr:hypothetical protein [Clostridia bacterium]
MDSSNNVNANKVGRELDIRDIIGYLFSKIWIIALVAICAIVFAFLITSFTTPTYTSTTKTMLINKNAGTGSVEGNLNVSDLSAATYLTKMSSEIFTSDSFSVRVANMLNSDEGSFTNILGFLDEECTKPQTFKNFYGGDIKYRDVKSSLSVKSNEDTCAVTLSSTTVDATLSHVIVTAAYNCMQDHINENFKVDSIVVGQIDYGKHPESPSNIHYFKNMALSAFVAVIAICAILLAFYIFDDKIKTPDDIEKHLGLSVLGEIPEIEDEV